MGKRSDFDRIPRDFYPTPESAVLPLLEHITDVNWFDEPCAGDGALIEHFKKYGFRCNSASDLEPQAEGIIKQDALTTTECRGDCFITNPPWARPILHPLITHLSDIAPTWLLFDADWAHTKQAAPFANRCRKIVSVGRVKWIPDSKHTGKDNCAWYLFDSPNRETDVGWGTISPGCTEFYFRSES